MLKNFMNRFSGATAPPESPRAEPTLGVQALGGQTVMSSDAIGMGEMFNIDGTHAGPHVTPASAMRVSAVYACVRLIAGAKASMPVEIRQSNKGILTEVDDHPYLPLLNEEPSPVCSAAVFWEFVENSRQLRGDAFALIVRTKNGVPTELLPFDWHQVLPERIGGRARYNVRLDDGTYRAFDQDDILHFNNFGWDGLRSMSTIQWAARESIGLSIAAETQSGNFFRNGSKPSVVLEYGQKLTAEVVDQLRAEFMLRYAGNANSHMPMILTGGTVAKTLTMSAVDAQLLESRKFEVVEIARAFGVPPFMIGESEKQSAWGAGMATMTQAFVNYTLRPHMVRDEQELKRKLFRVGNYKASFNERALLRGDLVALGEYYRAGIGGAQGPGWLKGNEIRKYESLPPDPDGNVLYSPPTQTGSNNETKPAA